MTVTVKTSILSPTISIFLMMMMTQWTITDINHLINTTTNNITTSTTNTITMKQKAKGIQT
jgi:hypothetical protein